MPPPTMLPSGTLVEELWGHPEQKYGVRVSRGSSIRARLDRFCHSRTGSIAYSLPSLRARAVATLSVSSSPEALTKTCPLGSSLPITRGGFAVPYSRYLDRGLDERALLF